MSLDNQTTLGDYAPQPQRRRVSRGRKALIGLMAIGAFAAVGGAGTFASFTASTDNAGGGIGDGENPFQTPDFALSNDVLARNGVDPTLDPCLSSDETEEFPVNPAEPDASNVDFVDLDGAAYCDALFTVNPAQFEFSQSADLRLENVGSEDGDLYFYAVDLKADDPTGNVAAKMSCIVDPELYADTAFHDPPAKTHVSLCGDWKVIIQEYHAGAAPLDGANTDDPFTTARANQCVVPWDNAANCGATGDALNALPLYSDDNARLVGSLPAETGKAPATDYSDSRFFRVSAELDADAGCTDNDTPGDPGTPDGHDDATGVGCYNGKMNGSAVVQVRWVLQ